MPKNSTHTPPEQPRDGGAGDTAGPAGGSALRITSKVNGFRRAGVAHPSTPTEYPADVFTPEQAEALMAEPNLVVEVI